MIIKNSYGIILFRVNPNTQDRDKKIQVLLTQRRTTYAFDEFVLGMYNKHNNGRIKHLFNNMTVQEKLIIRSCSFQFIWYHFRLTRDYYEDHYLTCKEKFESRFLIDNGRELKGIINSSCSGKLIYEFPKGRAQPGEAPMNCAVREFTEETGIKKSAYKLIPDISRTITIVKNCETFDIKYIMKYYVAIANHNFDVTLDFKNHEQIFEVGDIQWVSLPNLKYLDSKMTGLAEPLFNYIKKYY